MGLSLNPVAFKYKVFLKDYSYVLWVFFSYCVFFLENQNYGILSIILFYFAVFVVFSCGLLKCEWDYLYLVQF